MKNDAISDNNNRCIYCGDIIPEGRQVCYSCQDALANNKIRRKGLKKINEKNK